MAKAYTLTEQAVPTNPSATKMPYTSGLAAGTYYYKVFNVVNHTNWSYGLAFRSPITAEFSVTTDASNRKIMILIDSAGFASTDAIGVYRSTVSGDHNQCTNNVWKRNVASPTGAVYDGGVPLTDTVNCKKVYTFTFDGAVATLTPGETLTQATSGATAVVATNPAGGTTAKVHTITGTWNNSNAITGSVTGAIAQKWQSTSALNAYAIFDIGATGLFFPYLPLGLPKLTVSGGTSGDPITPQNIYDYLAGAAKTYCIEAVDVYGDWSNAGGNQLKQYLKYKFLLEVSDYYRIPTGIFVYHCVGKLYCNTGANYKMGDYDPTYDATSNGCAVMHQIEYPYYNRLDAMEMYDSLLLGKVEPETNYSLCNNPGYAQTTTSACKIYDSIYQDRGRNRWAWDCKRSRIHQTSMEIYGQANVATQTTFDNTYNCNHAAGETIIKDAIIKRRDADRVVYFNNYAYNYKTMIYQLINADISSFIAPTFVATNATARIPTDYLVLLQNDVNITVLDSNGSPVSGATITCKDSSGVVQSVLFPTTLTKNVTTPVDKAGTSVTVSPGTLTVGSKYRVGDERILVTANPSGATYTIERAKDGSTPNYIGHADVSARSIFYQIPDSVTTDANGFATFMVRDRKWASYSPTASSFGLTEQTRQGMLDITISKAGYRTYRTRGYIRSKQTLTVTLEPDTTGKILIEEIGNTYVQVA